MCRAVESGDYKCVELLLDYSLDCDVPTASRYCGMDAMVHQGLTPLMIACSKGFSVIAEMLLAHGANPKEVDEDLETPLYLAVKNGRYTCLKLLLEKGLSIDEIVTDDAGKEDKTLDISEDVLIYLRCPLAVAIKEKALRCIHMLLQYHCTTDRLVTNRSGVVMSPMEFGMAEHQISSCLMLLHGAPPPRIVNTAVFQEGMAWLALTDEEIFNKFIQRLQNVQNLTELCRWVIRKCLNVSGPQGVLKLPLPPRIMAFINLEELSAYY